MKNWIAGLILLAACGGLVPAAGAVECTGVLDGGAACGARMWRCNRCQTEGCDRRDCPDTLQNPYETERECRVCGSSDWSPLPDPEPAAEASALPAE